MTYDMGVGDWIGMIIGMTMMFAFLGGLILLAVWASRNFGRTSEASGARPLDIAGRQGLDRAEDEDTPLEIAEKRLARGEITKEQFEELRTILRHQE